MTDALDKADDVAVALTRLYQRDGVFAITIRIVPDSDALRMIYPRIDVYKVYRLLQVAAEQLLDGKVTTEIVGGPNLPGNN